MTSEKMWSTVSELKQLHEVNELLHSLDVLANLLLSAAATDPNEPLLRYLEQNLHFKPSQEIRLVS